MMKKTWIYIALIFFEIVLGFLYGLFLQSIVTGESYFFIAFCIPFTVLSILAKKQDMFLKISETIFLSFLFFMVAVLVLHYGNQIHAEFMDEYDVVVEFVNGRGGGSAEFTTPNGEEGRVDLHDNRIIIMDDSDRVKVGDTIRVREYKGFFNRLYYVLAEDT